MIDAIYKLYPNVTHTRGDEAFDVNGNPVDYDKDAVQAYVDSQAYIAKRQAQYPSIGDQLDALFKAGVFPADMAAKIQAVKDLNPKGAK